MADEIKDNQINESGYTTFGGTANRAGNYYTPTGPIGRFFAKFFATKAQIPVQQSLDNPDTALKNGDTIINKDVIKDVNIDSGPAIGGLSRNPILPQLELNRKKRYKEYEEMDEYPEIGAAFDIYADDCTQKGTKSERWYIKTDSELVLNEIEKFFESIKLDKLMWDIVRNTVKYGDCFTESIINLDKPDEGIKKIKVLNPNYILRVENEFGYLKKFLQEIPTRTSIDEPSLHPLSPDDRKKYIELDKNQITHFIHMENQ